MNLTNQKVPTEPGAPIACNTVDNGFKNVTPDNVAHIQFKRKSYHQVRCIG